MKWKRCALIGAMGTMLLVAGPVVPLKASARELAEPEVGTASAGPAERADVTGDGIADIVVATGARAPGFPDPSAPQEIGGSVYVIPGGASVPGQAPSLVHQDDPAVLDSPESTDNWGAQIVTGDFNGDRRADVVIGNPRESVGSVGNAGAITVLYGQSSAPYLGLIPNGTAWITENVGQVPGSVEAGDYFGAALASGDFNGDGFADLAVGSPGEAIGNVGAAGAVVVLYGGASGLRVDNAVAFDQSQAAFGGAVAEKNDHFGSSLAAGDVTGDGRDDLAINVEGENVGTVTGAEGCVYVLKGSAGGVITSGHTVACVSSVNTGGTFMSVAIGRFHGGSNADLIVFADQIRGGPNGSGVLAVFRGTSTGISSPGMLTFLSQNSAAVSDSAELGDNFGAALAIGDIDADGADDLAVGVPGEDTGGGSGQGAVQVFLGGTSGLTSALDFLFTEGHPLINATGGAGERFGSAVRLLDVTNDGRPELIVTAPFEDGSANTGTMFVLGLTRTSSSMTLTGCTTITRSSLGAISAFGTGFPLASGIIPPTDLPNVT